MALKLRKGTDAERLLVTFSEGELIYTTDTKQIFVGDGSTTGGVFVGPASSEALSLGGDLTLNGYDIVGTGNININGNITASGTINLGDNASDNVVFNADVNSDIIPNTDNTFDLGSSGSRWAEGWINTIAATTITTGTISGNLTGSVVGDLKGSVFGDDSSILVDSTNGVLRGTHIGNVTGNVTGNVLATDNSTMVNASLKTFTGNLTGNVTGDLNGTVTGAFSGQLLNGAGDVFLDTTSGIVPTLPANIIGDVEGSVYSDASTMLVDGTNGRIMLDGTVDTNIIPQTTNVHSIGSNAAKFNNAYLNGTLTIGDKTISSSDENLLFRGLVSTRSPVTVTLDGDIVGSSLTSFTVSDTLGIENGAVFYLPGTGLLTVQSTSGGDTVNTTTSFTASDAEDGDEVIFYNPAIRVASYKNSMPSQQGQPGDVKGMVFADTSYIYVCYADYDGVNPIWSRSAITSW